VSDAVGAGATTTCGSGGSAVVVAVDDEGSAEAREHRIAKGEACSMEPS
jgi:hypothetical protein